MFALTPFGGATLAEATFAPESFGVFAGVPMTLGVAKLAAASLRRASLKAVSVRVFALAEASFGSGALTTTFFLG